MPNELHSLSTTESIGLSDSQILAVIEQSLNGRSGIKRVLLIHPDYSRHDFSDRVVPQLYQSLKKRGLERLDTLNAGGTHRAMDGAELESKLGITKGSHPLLGAVENHEFSDPSQLVPITTLSEDFIFEMTSGNLRSELRVDVNRRVLEPYDLLIAVSGTVPHEALGYSGGTKIFFPGIAGPKVIGMLHWAAVLIGVPNIIGTIDNPAREIVNTGTRAIFERIAPTPILSLNMVYTEREDGSVRANGLFAGFNYPGFVEAHREAASLSSKLHIHYLDHPLDFVVQQIPKMYDEVWTAGKGSYKLQRPGVLSEGAEIVLFAPHIHCFHSNPVMDAAIRTIGYHGRDFVLRQMDEDPTTDRNIAAHVINVRGLGSLIDGRECFPFSVTLASQISEEQCRAVGLGYRDPNSVTPEICTGPGKLWIREGGQWLYERQSNSVASEHSCD
jgi:nickel-dependent lactate racemase